MRIRYPYRAACLACLAAIALALAVDAPAQSRAETSFQGVINDYAPMSVNPAGPWEIRGEWSLRLKGQSGRADFSAALTMVRSDLWVQLTGADPDNPAARSPHTHHVGIVDGEVTSIPNGFRVTGIAAITLNGNPAGFTGSLVQVDITGGTAVRFSNINVTFFGAAAGHFGAQPLAGVAVR